MTLLFVSLVLSVLLLGTLLLVSDRKTKLVERQLSTVLPSSVAATPLIMVRRVQERTDIRLLHLLRTVLLYKPGSTNLFSFGLIGMLIAFVSAVILAMLLPLWLAIVAGCVVFIMALRNLFGWQQNRYADKLIRQMPDAIETIVSAVRAGMPVNEAFRAVARDMADPTRTQFTLILEDMAMGRPVEEAVLDVFHRTGVSEYAMFSVTLGVQNKAGGKLAETLQTLGDSVRQRVGLAGRAKALSAEARLSSQVLTVLPFISGIIMYRQRPEAIMLLFTDPRGRFMFASGMISLFIGTFIMRRMIRKGTTV